MLIASSGAGMARPGQHLDRFEGRRGRSRAGRRSRRSASRRQRGTRAGRRRVAARARRDHERSAAVRAEPADHAGLPAEPELHGEQRRLRPVVHLQLPEDARDVVLHGLLADEEPLADLAVRLAGGEQLQDLLLARRQVGELLAKALLLALALELAQHAARRSRPRASARPPRRARRWRGSRPGRRSSADSRRRRP